MFNRRQFLASTLALATALTAVSGSALAAYATRPINLVVPFPPGATTDTIPRLIAQELGTRLGQRIVVVNRPGAGGVIGTKSVISSPPDGLNILLNTTAIVTNQAIKKQPDFDVLNDLTPVTLAVSGFFGIFVNPSVPVQNVGELIAYAKANPNKLNYGSGGIGAANHLLTELLANATGIRMTHVPYGGGAPALNALIANEIQVLVTDAWFGKPQADAGRVRLLAITADKAVSAYPGVSTVNQAGGPPFEAKIWFGFFAPGRTPEPIVRELSQEIGSVLNSSAVKDRLQSQGLVVEALPPEAFRAFLLQEIERWNSAVDSAKVPKE